MTVDLFGDGLGWHDLNEGQKRWYREMVVDCIAGGSNDKRLLPADVAHVALVLRSPTTEEDR